MSYSEADARQQLLDALGEAIDQLARALAALGGAYELLDDQQAERLEEQLFLPVQRAYGRARRTYIEFASRYRLSEREFAMRSSGLPSTGVRGFIEDALAAVEKAELELVALQESDVAIDVGDAELRAGLSEVRRVLDGLSQHAREFLRSYGR
jgi:hypothetical protein